MPTGIKLKPYSSLPKRRLNRSDSSDYARYFAVENGIQYRGHRQDLGPVMERARYLAHKEEALGGRKRSADAYLGRLKQQTPVAVLMTYLQQRNIPLDVYARNEGGVKDTFNKWLMSNRDLCKLQPDFHTAQKVGHDRIVVPKIIVPRASNNARFKQQDAEKCQTTSSQTMAN